jgi:hypothetical protein
MAGAMQRGERSGRSEAAGAEERGGLRTRVYDAVTGVVSGVIGLVSPFRAGRYRLGREMLRGYVSGATTGADQQFRPRLRSADADVKAGAKLTAARCRDQYQNNSLIAGGVERMCTNVVRKGIYPQFLFRTPDGKLDRKANTSWETMFRRWALYCDVTGHDSYGSLQFLGLRHMWFDGEYLVHRVWDDSLPGVVPLRLELIECQQLDRLVDGELPGGTVARRGVEYDKRTGRPLFYHVLDNHPGDYLALGRRASARRIPAADIIHVWDREMIHQYSGIAWLHAVVMEGYRMDEFRHITQDTARAQAIFAYFLKSQFPNFQMGPGIPAGGQASPYTPAATGHFAVPSRRYLRAVCQGLAALAVGRARHEFRGLCQQLHRFVLCLGPLRRARGAAFLPGAAAVCRGEDEPPGRRLVYRGGLAGRYESGADAWLRRRSAGLAREGGRPDAGLDLGGSDERRERRREADRPGARYPHRPGGAARPGV